MGLPTTMGHLATTAPGTQTSSAATATRKASGQKSATPASETMLPMVDANGKKYESCLVNNMAGKQDNWDAEPQYKDAHVGVIANLSPYHHLNW